MEQAKYVPLASLDLCSETQEFPPLFFNPRPWMSVQSVIFMLLSAPASGGLPSRHVMMSQNILGPARPSRRVSGDSGSLYLHAAVFCKTGSLLFAADALILVLPILVWVFLIQLDPTDASRITESGWNRSCGGAPTDVLCSPWNFLSCPGLETIFPAVSTSQVFVPVCLPYPVCSSLVILCASCLSSQVVNSPWQGLCILCILHNP